MRSFPARARFWRNHRWAPGHMSDYLDAELAPRARTRIERHLGECAECRRLLAGLRQTLELLRLLPAPEGAGHAPAIAASVRGRLNSPG